MAAGEATWHGDQAGRSDGGIAPWVETGTETELKAPERAAAPAGMATVYSMERGSKGRVELFRL